MGGDINCRYGNLNVALQDQGLLYSDNADMVSNHHGRTYGIDLCSTTNIFPINHLKYGRKVYAGEHTYFKGDKKSTLTKGGKPSEDSLTPLQ